MKDQTMELIILIVIILVSVLLVIFAKQLNIIIYSIISLVYILVTSEFIHNFLQRTKIKLPSILVQYKVRRLIAFCLPIFLCVFSFYG